MRTFVQNSASLFKGYVGTFLWVVCAYCTLSTQPTNGEDTQCRSLYSFDGGIFWDDTGASAWPGGGARGGGCQIKQERDPFVTHARRTEVLCVSYKKCIHSSSTEVKSHLVRPASPDEPEVESTR